MNAAPRRRRSVSDDGPRVALGYVRVSSASQRESGAGLADHRRAIGAECERRRWDLAHIHADSAVSGRSLDRRLELRAALQTLAAGTASVLVTAKLDRLSRSVLDFASLMARAEREGWAIVVLDVNVDTSTPSGEMMANVVVAFAQYERRLISERTKRALAVKRAEGVRLGRPRSIPDEIRNLIIGMRSDGKSYQSIADALNADDIPRGQNGNRWWPSTIQLVIDQAS
jgi:DNA invertase Pin-like site-specific DNA recombinase